MMVMRVKAIVDSKVQIVSRKSFDVMYEKSYVI